MRPTLAIMFGVAIAASKLISPPLDSGHELVGADDIGASLFSLASLLALGEDGHADGLAGAMRQGDGTANVLVGLTGCRCPDGNAPSTVSSNLAGATSFTRRTASSGL